MSDYASEAEALFRAFAERHSFAIEKIEEPEVELLMRVPAQRGLAFELTLALQNGDELNIGFAGFWSYFFPFGDVRERVASALDAIADGDCRLAIHEQFGRVVKRVLEQRVRGRWRRMYAALETLHLPLWGTDVSYLYNEDARDRTEASLP